MNKVLIEKILNISVLAPSGDNSQPWRFAFCGLREVEIFCNISADSSVYDYQSRGSILSCGAVLENIKIAARHLGLKAEIFPEFSENNKDSIKIAKIAFSPAKTNPHELFPNIPSRHTNRLPYQTKPISEADRQTLVAGASEFPEIKINFLLGQQKIAELSKVLCVNEKLIFENLNIKTALFKIINWGGLEKNLSEGLHIKTLGLKPPQEFVFRQLRGKKFYKLFKSLGLIKLIVKDSQKLYSQSGGYVLFSSDSLNQPSLLKCGMSMQKFWLTANKLGIALQPTTALLYLQQRIEGGDKRFFENKEVELIKNSCKKILELFELPIGHALMLCRIGYEKEIPKFMSGKKSAIILL